MTRNISIWGRIWQNLKNSFGAFKQEVKFVGEDHLGNRYFEKISEPKKNLKGSKWVETLDGDQFKCPEIPVEWNAWLRNRREFPPTQEEIDRNYAKMMKTIKRAEAINEKLAIDEFGKNKENLPEGQKSRYTVFPEYEITPGKSRADKNL